MLTEDDLEQLCLGWFAEQGWEIHHGPDIAPDGSNPQRASYHDVFLTPVLNACLQKSTRICLLTSSNRSSPVLLALKVRI